MPRMNGIELVKSISRIYNNNSNLLPKILVCTANTKIQNIINLSYNNIIHILQKPFSSKQFIFAIQFLLKYNKKQRERKVYERC